MARPGQKRTESIPVYFTVASDGPPGNLTPLLDLLIRRGLQELRSKEAKPNRRHKGRRPRAKGPKRKAKQ